MRLVLIWLNGPFGIGKSSAAEALVERLPDSLLFDPELLGSMLRRILSRIDSAEDYQDLPPWRSLLPVIVEALRTSYQCRDRFAEPVRPAVGWPAEARPSITTGCVRR